MRIQKRSVVRRQPASRHDAPARRRCRVVAAGSRTLVTQREAAFGGQAHPGAAGFEVAAAEDRRAASVRRPPGEARRSGALEELVAVGRDDQREAPARGRWRALRGTWDETPRCGARRRCTRPARAPRRRSRPASAGVTPAGSVTGRSRRSPSRSAGRRSRLGAAQQPRASGRDGVAASAPAWRATAACAAARGLPVELDSR